MTNQDDVKEFLSSRRANPQHIINAEGELRMEIVTLPATTKGPATTM
jgi:hypothetical protein